MVRYNPTELDKLVGLVGSHRAHEIRRGAIPIAVDYKMPVDALLDAAYIVVSAGHGDDAVKVLSEACEMAARAKSRGVLADVANTLVATMNAYDIPIDKFSGYAEAIVDASNIMDLPFNDQPRWRNWLPCIVVAGALGVPLHKALGAMIYHSRNPIGNGHILARKMIHDSTNEDM